MATTTLGTTTVTTDEVVTIALEGEVVTLTGQETAYLVDLVGEAAQGVELADGMVALDVVVTLPGDLVVVVKGVELDRDDVAARVSAGYARVLADVAAGE